MTQNISAYHKWHSSYCDCLHCPIIGVDRYSKISMERKTWGKKSQSHPEDTQLQNGYNGFIVCLTDGEPSTYVGMKACVPVLRRQDSLWWYDAIHACAVICLTQSCCYDNLSTPHHPVVCIVICNQRKCDAHGESAICHRFYRTLDRIPYETLVLCVWKGLVTFWPHLGLS